MRSDVTLERLCDIDTHVNLVVVRTPVSLSKEHTQAVDYIKIKYDSKGNKDCVIRRW